MSAVPAAATADGAGAGTHPLSRTYCIWYRFRNQRAQRVGYKQGIKVYGKFSTVEGFWHLYGHMLRAEELPLVDICVFEEGIKPAWEDEANANGGQWAVKLHKSFTAYCWEGALMALIGDQIDTAPGDAVHGLFLSVRFKDTSIAVWNSSVESRDDAVTVGSLRRAMELDDSFSFEFRAHGVAAVKPQHHYNPTGADSHHGSDSLAGPGGRVGFQHPRTVQHTGGFLRPRTEHPGGQQQHHHHHPFHHSSHHHPARPYGGGGGGGSNTGRPGPWGGVGVHGHSHQQHYHHQAPGGGGFQPPRGGSFAPRGFVPRGFAPRGGFFSGPQAPKRSPVAAGGIRGGFTSSGNRFANAFGQPQQQWEPMSPGHAGAAAAAGGQPPQHQQHQLPQQQGLGGPPGGEAAAGPGAGGRWRRPQAGGGAGGVAPPTNSRWS